MKFKGTITSDYRSLLMKNLLRLLNMRIKYILYDI